MKRAKIMNKKERLIAMEDAMFNEQDFFYLAVADKIGGAVGAKKKILAERHRHGKAIMSEARIKELSKPVKQTIRFETTGGIILVEASAFTGTGKIRKSLMASYQQFRKQASTIGGEYILRGGKVNV